jgi:hypothetical protein
LGASKLLYNTRNGIVAIKVNNTINFAAILTNKIADDRKRQEGRVKSEEERIRCMQNRGKHIEMIKNLPKMTSGYLMAFGWLRMDSSVLENQCKRKQQL